RMPLAVELITHQKMTADQTQAGEIGHIIGFQVGGSNAFTLATFTTFASNCGAGYRRTGQCRVNSGWIVVCCYSTNTDTAGQGNAQAQPTLSEFLHDLTLNADS